MNNKTLNLFTGSSGSEKPLEKGASRYWELCNRSRYSCIGANGPINLEETVVLQKKLQTLFDFENSVSETTTESISETDTKLMSLRFFFWFLVYCRNMIKFTSN